MAVSAVDVIAWALLAVGVAATLLSCVGVLVMPNVFDRLHYTAPASTVGALGIALSIVAEEGWAAASVKAMVRRSPIASRPATTRTRSSWSTSWRASRRVSRST